MLLKSFQIQMLEIKENDVLISFPIEVEQWFLQVSSSFCEINSMWLNSLQPFPSCEASIPQRICVEKLLQNIPSSWEQLRFEELESLHCLLSSLSFSSIK
ncbi:hypothetical protein IEQ34_008190 [Dendrobium chrysotoxum]|uniref:Uncharacterized protein n=1 Tax=Dendrobium chrysotoxum TaxID=161865 RepID=A0AAV7H7W7_DENCH|nr:hypothetical protein IEQ34_008190 [Dendrobium chrysotoxum]